MGQEGDKSSPVQLEYAKIDPNEQTSGFKGVVGLVLGLFCSLLGMWCIPIGLIFVIAFLRDPSHGTSLLSFGVGLILLLSSFGIGLLAFQYFRDFIRAFWWRR